MTLVRENIQQYSEDELSLRVFNDEYLYSIRHTPELYPALVEMFVASKDQVAMLKHDLILDAKENCKYCNQN